jgi:periplasmic glucans biosynthesis protein
MRRRAFLETAALLPAALLPLSRAFAAGSPAGANVKMLGSPQPFDYAWLKGQARSQASKPFRRARGDIPEQLQNLDWDQYQDIRYRADHALWAGDRLRFQVQFFHLGLFYRTPVRIFEVAGGLARELAYDPAMFNYGSSKVDGSRLPSDQGFAGFRLLYHTDPVRDIVAFLGASYFRAVGGEMQYGISARGLAIDTGMDRAEEFPDFTAFWLERPLHDSGHLAVYALMDSPSVAGAYRFIIYPAATLVMDVDAALYPRKEIERLGVAPLTSMFLHGDNDRRVANDWRPKIHDSDGLAMWTGSGEWIWRPVVNPATRRVNSFLDENPRGFGLLQRDRNFDHYQDDGVFYEKRPSLWVEPKSGWGRGSVQLVELPTSDETFDNVVAFWHPADKPRNGEELLFGYRLYWGSKMPASPPLAQVFATRTGIGGIVGQKRKYFSWRFAVDFAGGDLSMVGRDVKVEPVITASRGQIELAAARRLDSIQCYRAMFDLKPGDSSLAPVDLRLYLRAEAQPLTETWLYQWTPPEQQKYQ